VQHCRVFARALDAEPSSAPLRLYVHALCVEDAATDAYLGGLPSDGLRRVVDLQKQGLGRRTGGMGYKTVRRRGTQAHWQRDRRRRLAGYNWR
jgi:hypothetical protein